MPERRVFGTWRPSRWTLFGALAFVAGLLLASLSWWFLLLSALGACGPGACRELGWIRDKDEFQRQADRRAGYHAFLVTGFAAFGLLAYFRSGDRALEHPQELTTLLLALLWFTWIFSSLVAYWGARATASRLLLGFGTAWLLFTILSNTGSEWTGWTGLLMHSLLVLPFLGLSWTSGRWPRITGLLLLGASLFFIRFFRLFEKGPRELVDDGLVLLLFVGPLLASGLALLLPGPVPSDDDA